MGSVVSAIDLWDDFLGALRYVTGGGKTLLFKEIKVLIEWSLCKILTFIKNLLKKH